jgi:hypothetical protein
MCVNLLSILKIYDDERFIAGTREGIRCSVSLSFDGESLEGSENPSFLRCTWDDSENIAYIRGMIVEEASVDMWFVHEKVAYI